MRWALKLSSSFQISNDLERETTMSALASLAFETSNEIPLVEVLTTKTGSDVFGFRITGFYTGPSVLVAGHALIADQVYARLMQIPTLGWMRGTLTLVFLNMMEGEGLSAHLDTQIDPTPDELLFLP
jgi:hypothetical protein